MASAASMVKGPRSGPPASAGCESCIFVVMTLLRAIGGQALGATHCTRTTVPPRHCQQQGLRRAAVRHRRNPSIASSFQLSGALLPRRDEPEHVFARWLGRKRLEPADRLASGVRKRVDASDTGPQHVSGFGTV